MATSSKDTQAATPPRWVWIFGGIQVLLIGVLLGHGFELRMKPVEMDYNDWIAILLTGVALIVSVLAVFLGVLAIIGWQSFDRSVQKAVDKSIDKAVGRSLRRGFGVKGGLRPILQQAVERVSFDLTGADEGEESPNDDYDGNGT